MMNQKKRELLLKLARDVLRNKLCSDDNDIRKYKIPEFNVKRGLFVTLMKNDNLRGCIGRIEPTNSIYQQVIHLAISAALEDHRFQPVQAAELSQIVIELSLLTVPEIIEGKDNTEKISQIRPFVDGVILNSGHYRSTFLPQVWDSLSDRDKFISELCRKAGLSYNHWRKEPIEFLSYQVEHFQEELK
jgi:uncharacterized protein